MKTSTILLFSGIAILPGPAAAQIDASRDRPPISIQIAEARRTPFHARSGAHTSLVPGRLAGSFLPLRAAGYRPAHPFQEAVQEAPDSSPSFVRVFVPTLVATYLADFVGFWAFICWGYGGGSDCIDNEATNLALWVTVPVVVPAITAGRISGRHLSGFVGSALGTIAAIVSASAIDSDHWPVFVPAIDAAVTTFLTLALPDLGLRSH